MWVSHAVRHLFRGNNNTIKCKFTWHVFQKEGINYPCAPILPSFSHFTKRPHIEYFSTMEWYINWHCVLHAMWLDRESSNPVTISPLIPLQKHHYSVLNNCIVTCIEGKMFEKKIFFFLRISSCTCILSLHPWLQLKWIPAFASIIN